MKDKNLKFKILAVLALIGIAVFLYLQIFGIIDPFGIMPTPAPTASAAASSR